MKAAQKQQIQESLPLIDKALGNQETTKKHLHAVRELERYYQGGELARMVEWHLKKFSHMQKDIRAYDFLEFREWHEMNQRMETRLAWHIRSSS